MLDKLTFSKLMDELETYVCGLKDLESILNVRFDENFIATHVDKLLNIIGESFFTAEHLNTLEEKVVVDTVKDILFYYVVQGEFGLKVNKLKSLYVENKGLSTEVTMNAYTSSDLYDIIVRYLFPSETCETVSINC